MGSTTAEYLYAFYRKHAATDNFANNKIRYLVISIYVNILFHYYVLIVLTLFWN